LLGTDVGRLVFDFAFFTNQQTTLNTLTMTEGSKTYSAQVLQKLRNKLENKVMSGFELWEIEICFSSQQNIIIFIAHTLSPFNFTDTNY